MRPIALGPIGLALLALAWVGACAVSRSSVRTPGDPDRFFVAGYHPYWAPDSWVDYPYDVLDEIYFFELEVAGDGSFLDRHGWPYAWQGLAETSAREGVGLTPTISMHDPVAFETLFSEAGSVERLVSGISALVSATPGLSGVHLDFEVFEPVSTEARDGFTGFVAALKPRLAAVNPDLLLSVFALAFDDDDVYDEEALGELADYLVIQGYDYHSPEGERAGPVAPVAGWGRLNWQSAIERFDEAGVARRKLVMSVPMYGYEWPVEGPSPGSAALGTAVTVPLAPPPDILPELPRARARTASHGQQRDAASGTVFYTFELDGEWFQGWIEDPTSLRAKYDFVRSRGLGGIAIFPLAYGDQPLWADLREAFARPRD